MPVPCDPRVSRFVWLVDIKRLCATRIQTVVRGAAGRRQAVRLIEDRVNHLSFGQLRCETGKSLSHFLLANLPGARWDRNMTMMELTQMFVQMRNSQLKSGLQMRAEAAAAVRTQRPSCLEIMKTLVVRKHDAAAATYVLQNFRRRQSNRRSHVLRGQASLRRSHKMMLPIVLRNADLGIDRTQAQPGGLFPGAKHNRLFLLTP